MTPADAMEWIEVLQRLGPYLALIALWLGAPFVGWNVGQTLKRNRAWHKLPPMSPWHVRLQSWLATFGAAVLVGYGLCDYGVVLAAKRAIAVTVLYVVVVEVMFIYARSRSPALLARIGSSTPAPAGAPANGNGGPHDNTTY